MSDLIERLEYRDFMNRQAARLRIDERDTTDEEAAAELRRLRDEVSRLREALQRTRRFLDDESSDWCDKATTDLLAVIDAALIPARGSPP
jgi:hypothetical protein